MKKFLFIFILSLIGICSANAQVLTFRSQAYCQKTINSYGSWSSWSNWESCNVPITINLNNDQVIIYSKRTQYYQIYNYSNSYYDSGAECVDYNFYDQDGDRGIMTLVIKPNGQSEIYIRFADIQWAYIVIRT
ncbi:MAG: hypothetical protein J1F35_03455 [Erysipelotrichales bacterium]|nr:hypothetical protein [Erysipelotrichales bacterium]